MTTAPSPVEAPPYESDRLFRRLLATHPGVVVDAEALLSAAPAGSPDRLPPLVRLLECAREAGLPVALRGEHRYARVRSEYGRHGLHDLWTEVLPAGQHQHASDLPYVTAVLPEQAQEFLTPVPGLLVTVAGRLTGPPQHPVPLQPYAEGVFVQLMTGRTYAQITELSRYPRSFIGNTTSRSVRLRGCVNAAHLIARAIVDGYLDPVLALRTAVSPPTAPKPADLDFLIATIGSELTDVARRFGRTVGTVIHRRHFAIRALGGLTPIHARAIALAIGVVPDSAIPARGPYPVDGRGPTVRPT
ncbi:hypothetical protein ACFV4P_34180 [Kitasatospora sp. NPDC059795]|uniref:hypothetical protein n=1 Tax=Kitasatospora sp. NPDC059795 TaxID=3346949 RepID=UPI00365113A9